MKSTLKIVVASLMISLVTFNAVRVDTKPLAAGASSGAATSGGGANSNGNQQNQNQVRFRRLPPKEFSAALGSSITIECEAHGSPPPSIHWLRDGKRIAQNEFDDNTLDLDTSQVYSNVDGVNKIALSSTKSRLFIDCADLQDEAVYTCVAENEFSRISSQTKLNLIKPTNLAAAAAAVSAAAAAAAAAAASTSPEANLNSANELANMADEVAALELAAAAPKGQTSQMAESLAELEALDRSRLSALAQCLSQRNASAIDPIRIHMWTHNMVEIMNNNVILFCRSNAKQLQQTSSTEEDLKNLGPSSTLQQQQMITTTTISRQQSQQQPIVRWKLPDERIVDPDMKDKFEVLETGDLLVKDIQWADMGQYWCTVSDEHSSDSVSSFVYPTSIKLLDRTTG